MDVASNYNIFEIKWFDEFLSAYKIDNVIRPSAADVEAYRGKLPDFLLRFWIDHGWCSWSDGQYWLCNPSLPKPVLDYVFRGDPELDPKECTPLAIVPSVRSISGTAMP